MYTKDKLVEQVLINVSGGQLSEDVNVWREDIETFVPAAIAHVLQEDVDMRRQMLSQERKRNRSNIMPVIEPEYSFVYDLVIQKDTGRCLDYVTIPGRLLKIADGRGVSQIVPYNGRPLTIVRNQGETVGLEDIGQPLAWIEYYPTEDKIMVIGLSQTVTNLLVHATIDPSNIDGDDPLPIPQHLEAKVIDMCVIFFRQQRGMPADSIVDNIDVNEVRHNR